MVALEAAHELGLQDAAQARARLAASRQRKAHIEANVAPLIDEQLADLKKQADLGAIDVLLTLESLTRAYETKMPALEAHLDEAQAATRLRWLIDPPPSTPVLKNLSNKEPLR